MMPKLYLRKNEERRIQAGHQWAFGNEIEKIDGEISNGELAYLYDASGQFLATGFYNKNSLISFRIISRKKIEELGVYFKDSILKANDLRQKLFKGRTAYRMVFAESDSLPGLVIDRYNDTYVLQIHSAGMEAHKNYIVAVLRDELQAKVILTKHDFYFRKLEGIPEADEILFGEPKDEIIVVEDVKYEIGFKDTQKTGFFFDQAMSRIYTATFCKGKSVLDCFCNSGGFGLQAAAFGAESILFSDESSTMLEVAKNNYALNNFKAPASFVEGDAFKVLKQLADQENAFDIVILDPPAFVKSKKKLYEAIKGYLTINALALKLVKSSGFFVTSSCSHHLDRDVFLQTINKAALKAGREIKLLHFAGAAPDHPVLLAMPETSYLKFAFFAVD